MKGAMTKRKIFDAVDLLTENPAVHEEKADGVVLIKIDQIRPFHDHPFQLYERERLTDMMNSIKENGILNPVIVQQVDDSYEMLSGHNRMNAAQLVGITEIPAIVKKNLTAEEAYVYVVETNVMQRSFGELLPSEKAAVMEVHYSKICCQGKRNDILRELRMLNGDDKEKTFGQVDQKLNSRKAIAKEYGFSSRSAARYLRINFLTPYFKNLVDEDKVGLTAAVDVSYLPEEEQVILEKVLEELQVKLRITVAEKLHKLSGSLTEDMMRELILGNEKPKEIVVKTLQIPKNICKKYLAGMDEDEMVSVVEQALAAWFNGKGNRDVSGRTA